MHIIIIAIQIIYSIISIAITITIPIPLFLLLYDERLFIIIIQCYALILVYHYFV